MKLGHALTFYAKYPEEMYELCYGESQRILDVLPEPDREEVKKKGEEIRIRAESQCKELLGKAAEQVESALQGKCGLERIRTRGPWGVRWRLWRSRGKSVDKNRVEAQIWVWVHNQQLVLQSALWIAGELGVERRAIAILNGKDAEIGTAHSPEWDRGTVVFKEIPIVVPGEVDNLDADALVGAALAPLGALTGDELERIFSLAAP